MFRFQKFVDNPRQCFAFTPQTNFPVHDLNFIGGEGDGIESRLPFKIFSTLPILYVCNVFKKTNLKTVEAYMEVPALLFLDWGVKLPLETRALEDLTVFPKVLDMFYFCLPLFLDFLKIVLIGNLFCQ